MAITHVQEELKVSERRACRVLGQARAVQRYTPQVREDEAPLTARTVELAAVYGRYGTANRSTGLGDWCGNRFDDLDRRLRSTR